VDHIRIYLSDLKDQRIHGGLQCGNDGMSVFMSSVSTESACLCL